MRFSILIPTLDSRREMAEALWAKIAAQAASFDDVEVLMLRDNKRRSIGGKRQALLDAAKGDYIAFVDDDDDVDDMYVKMIYIAIQGNSDLVVFPIRCTINGGDEGIVEPSIKYIPKDGEPLAEYKPPVTYRPPHELVVMRRSVVQYSKFPDTSQGEDFGWAKQWWCLVNSEFRIPHPLYHWRHNIKLREHEEKPA